MGITQRLNVGFQHGRPNGRNVAVHIQEHYVDDKKQVVDQKNEIRFLDAWTADQNY